MWIWVGRCCLCGDLAPIVHCPECGHDFCEACKRAYFRRGLEALKALLGQSDLYCGGKRHG